MTRNLNITPLLTIAIPTFNRLTSLKDTINSLSPLLSISDIEIVIIDNCSTDGTWEWLSSEKGKKRFLIRKNVANLGIEGNIIQALFSGTGKYVWLLSDHMVVYPSEIKTFLIKLRSGLDFDIGFARVSVHDSILPSIYTPTKIKMIDQYSLGKIIFYMGNISAFLCNRQYIYRCARSVYRFSSFSYPQLGIFLHAKGDSTLIELPSVAEFSSKQYGRIRISYDSFRSRFIGYVKAIDQLRKLNLNLRNIDRALKTRLLILALASESILDLSFSKGKGISTLEYFFCFRHYPGKMRLFLFVCMLLSLWPGRMKRRLSRMVFRTVMLKKYEKVARSFGQRFSNETFKE